MIEEIIAYTAISLSILGRFVFMYLLYTKKSTNPYSLLFCVMNICSSSLWITYGQLVLDTPILVRSSSDLLLFVISSLYIEYNRIQLYKIHFEIERESKSETSKIIM
jgi:uncharacterized protein with PQ loop repeat